jgi:excisionase family DNA binding protein
MDQPTSTPKATDSTPAFTLTKGQLRELIREEVQSAIAKVNGVRLNPEPGGSQKPYLTVKEAADFARLAPSTMRLYIRKRRLKAQRVGRRVIIARGELEAFLSRAPIEAGLQ